MKSNLIRLVSWLLVIAMLAAMPITVFAAEEHEHVFDTNVKSPTCTSDGFTKHYCSECGYLQKTDYIPARHSYDDGVYKEGKDDAAGYTLYTCTSCGATMKELDHSHVFTEIVHAPTCVRNGYLEYKCTACEYRYFDYDTELATDHDWGDWAVSKAATTSAKGEEKRVCKKCGEAETRPTDQLDPSAKTITIKTDVVKVYDDASTSAEVVGVVLKGSKFNMEARNSNSSFYRIGTDMWVEKAGVSVDDNSYPTSAFAGAKYFGTAQNSVQLKVRTGPSELSALVSSLSSGSQVAIYSITKDENNAQWGRISKTEEKWVDLTYVDVQKVIASTLPDGNSASGVPSTTPSSSSTSTATQTVKATGVVNSSINLNVRKDASISVLNLMGSLPTGTKVDIYQTKDVSGHTWGQINYNGSKGWICLDYVNITSGSSSATGSTSTGTSSTIAAAPNATVVNCSTGVNVRKSASVTGGLVGVIPVNTRIALDDMDDGWYHVSGRGWVFGDYVKLDAAPEALFGSGSSTSKPIGNETPLPTYTQVSVPAIFKQVGEELVVYSKASTDSSKLITLLPNADKVFEITGRTIVSGIQWGKVTVSSGISGWVQMNRINLPEVSGVVSAASANVYESRNADDEVLTTLGSNTKVTIVADSQTTDGTYVWGKVKGSEGYIQMHKLTLSYNTEYIANGSVVRPVSIAGKISIDNAELHKNASKSSDALLKLAKGTAVSITEWTSEGGITWGKATVGNFTGWINMSEIAQNAISGTVTADSVNLYKDYTSNTIELVRRSGEKIVVLERVLYGTSVWGRINENKVDYWCNLAGVTLEGQSAPVTAAPSAPTTTTPTTTTTTTTTAPATATVATITNADKVNVRAKAGVRNDLVTTLARGTKVNVYEQTTVDGALWCRIDQGWVAMSYVDLSTKTTTTAPTGTASTVVSGGEILTTVPSGAVAVGFVNIADLAVRSAANQNASKVGTLKKGANVVIYEQQLIQGMIWGRIDSGWICTSYVTLTGLSVTGAGEAGIIKGCFYTANVRSTPGVSNALVGKIMVNSRVEILETTVVGSQTWGRTSIGWIAMDYVLTGSIPVI